MHALKLMLLSRLTGAWQFRWPALAAAFAVCIAGWVGVALIPNTFRSEAKVYIDTNTLLGPLLKGLAVTTDTDQEIAVMLRSLLANPNMERVVRATDPSAATMSSARMQDAIDKLRQNIALRNLGAVNLYNITYDGPDPTYAQTVTQSLLSVLIDSNLGNQRRDSENVQTFLDTQIADYEQKLNQADKLRADFKSSHIDFFSVGANGGPAEVGGGVVAATAAVTQAQKELDTALALRDNLAAQIKATPATLDVNAPAPVVSEGSQGAMSFASQLTIARSRLNDLRTRYTDDYPDVIAQQHLIARLQAELKADPGNASGNTQGISNPTFVALRTKLADLQGTVVVDQDQLKRAQALLDKAKQSALDAITIERQYENLNRDYEVIHQNYEQLVARRESANISQAAGGQQSAVFQVISPPLKPDRPLAPNRLLLNAAVLLGGLAVGLGVSVILSEFYGRFFGLESLTDAFSLPVLGSITLLRTSADMMQQRRSAAAFAAGVGVLLLGYLVVLYLFHNHLASAQPDIL